jgi:PAS domain S-box-containing protein
MIKKEKKSKKLNVNIDLYKNKSILTSAFNATADGILIVDNRGKISNYNQKFIDLWHIPNKILETHSDKKALSYVLKQLIYPNRFLSIIKELYKKPEKESFDILEFKDGRIFERYSIPQKINEKDIIGRVWSFRDITEKKKYEEKLIQSEERFHNLFENANDAIWLMDKETFIDCNDKAVKLFKCENKAHILNHTPMHFSPNKQPDGSNSKNKALKYIKLALSGHPQRFYWQHKGENKTLIDTEISLNRIEENGKLYIQAIGRDITFRKNEEEKLRQSEERFKNIYKYSAAGISLINIDGQWIDVNDEFCKITGYTRDELLRLKFTDITYKDDIKKSKENFKNLIKNRIKHIYFEKRYIHKNSNIIWVYLSLSLLSDSLGKPLYYITHIQDISHNKQVEDSLKDSEEKYRTLIENSPDAVVVYIDGKITYVNNECINLMKAKNKEELIGKSVMKFIHPNYRELVVNRMKMITKEGIVLPNMEEKFVRLDGSFIDVEVKSMSLKIGGKLAVQLIARDITERKKNQLALLKSENKYYTLMNLAVDAIILGTHEGIITDVNEYMCEILGMIKKDFIGKHISNLPFTKESLDKSPFRFDLLQKGEIVTNDRILLNKDGSLIYVEMRTKMMPDGTYHSIYRNITERKRNADFIKLVLNSIPDFVFWKDISSIYKGCNDAFAKAAGLSGSDEIVGKTDYDLNWKKEESDSFVRDDKRIMKNNHAEYHIIEPQLQSGGKQTWVETCKVPLVDENANVVGILGTYIDITTKINDEKKLLESEEKYRRLFESSKDSILILDEKSGEIIDLNPFVFNLLGYSKEELIGKKIYEITPFNSAINDENKFNEFKIKGYIRYDNLSIKTKSGLNKYIEFILSTYLVGDKKLIQCNIRDLTERRDLEEAKIGFLSITSHQLRTPLSITKWVLDSILHDDELNPKQINKINDLVISNERLINLVNDLLNVSLIETGKLLVNKKNIDLGKLIKDLSLTFRILSEKKKENIILKIIPDLTNIYCDPIIIHEVVENLLSNALNYSKEGSKDIILSVIERKDDYLVSVNNDAFIEPISADKIKNFGKFVRGVNAQEIEPAGSGLGLYITKKMIEAHGGTIWFESNTESGTTFYVTIIKK